MILFRTIYDIAQMIERERAGYEASPTTEAAGSQTVEGPAPGAVLGFDGSKKTIGRKRHIVVDTVGPLLLMNFIPANVSDSYCGQTILDAIRNGGPG